MELLCGSHTLSFEVSHRSARKHKLSRGRIPKCQNTLWTEGTNKPRARTPLGTSPPPCPPLLPHLTASCTDDSTSHPRSFHNTDPHLAAVGTKSSARPHGPLLGLCDHSERNWGWSMATSLKSGWCDLSCAYRKVRIRVLSWEDRHLASTCITCHPANNTQLILWAAASPRSHDYNSV